LNTTDKTPAATVSSAKAGHSSRNSAAVSNPSEATAIASSNDTGASTTSSISRIVCLTDLGRVVSD